MSKKKLNEDAIVNELTQSAFFRQPEPALGADDSSPRADQTTASATLPDTPDSSPARTVVRPVRAVRVMKSRHPFDIYQDQLESLQRLSAEERMQGGLGSMSKMVRDAIDAYLESRGRPRE